MILHLAFAVALIALSGYVARSWVVWFRQPKAPKSNWRSLLLLAGMAAASVSLMLVVGLFINALVTGGFPFYHPILIRVLRIGSLTAICGLGGALAGKGKQRISTAACSIFCLLVWLTEAEAQ
jgi:hypothetical protein